MGILVFKVFLRPTAGSGWPAQRGGLRQYGLARASSWPLRAALDLGTRTAFRCCERRAIRSRRAEDLLPASRPCWPTGLQKHRALHFFFAVAVGMNTALGVYIATILAAERRQPRVDRGRRRPRRHPRTPRGRLSRKLDKKPMTIGLYAITLVATILPVTLAFWA